MSIQKFAGAVSLSNINGWQMMSRFFFRLSGLSYDLLFKENIWKN